MISFVVQGIQWQIINTQRMALQKTNASTRHPEWKIFMKMDLLFYQIHPIKGWNEKIPPYVDDTIAINFNAELTICNGIFSFN